MSFILKSPLLHNRNSVFRQHDRSAAGAVKAPLLPDTPDAHENFAALYAAGAPYFNTPVFKIHDVKTDCS
jgi:hypothetical protein